MVLPLAWLARLPNEQQFLNCRPGSHALRHYEDAWTMLSRRQGEEKGIVMPGHCALVVRQDNTSMFQGMGKHRRIGPAQSARLDSR